MSDLYRALQQLPNDRRISYSSLLAAFPVLRKKVSTPCRHSNLKLLDALMVAVHLVVDDQLTEPQFDEWYQQLEASDLNSSEYAESRNVSLPVS